MSRLLEKRAKRLQKACQKDPTNNVKALDFLKASEEFFFFAQMMKTVVEVGNENETLRQIINFLEEDGAEIPNLPPPKKDSVLN